MNGEQLYAKYREAAWETHVADVESWPELEPEQKLVWDQLAENLEAEKEE
jgi:hypothetical protein